MMGTSPVFLIVMKSHYLVPALVFSLTAAPLPAAVNYVDATLANTDIVGGGADSLWADGDDGTTGGTVADGAASNDGLWRFRGGFGNGGIWEATGSSASAEDAVEIVTSTAVADGLYNVYVFYYAVNTSGDYPIRAGLASNANSNPVFDRAGNKGTAGGDALAELMFDTAPPTGGEGRTLLYGLVGQTTVTGGTLDVFIDDWPASLTGSSNDRTWYSGVGYELVPEPSSALLAAFGSLLLLRRRRD